MLWLSGALLLSLLTGTIFYIITGLSQWAALLLLSILVLVAFFRRWPPARRAMLTDRLIRAEPWIWAGALIAGVISSVILVWSGEFGSAWIVLGLVGVGLVVWVKRQDGSDDGETTEDNNHSQSDWLATRDRDWLLKAQLRKALGLPNVFSAKFGRSSKL
ncbi:MAG: hypothetical protein U1F76_20365 [Candidatus Competibacteraceae bacterium]